MQDLSKEASSNVPKPDDEKPRTIEQEIEARLKSMNRAQRRQFLRGMRLAEKREPK
jgi:hypothetical protein